MSRTFNGSTDKGIISSGILTALDSANAFHISVWGKSTSLTAQQFAFAVGSTSSNNPIIVVGLDGTATGDKMYAFCRDNSGAGGSVMFPSNGYSANTWHLMTLRNKASNDRTSNLDANSASGVSNSTSVGTFTPLVTSLGCMKRTTETGFFNGKIGRVAIWRGVVADLPDVEEQQLLYLGADPSLIKASSLAYYWDDDLAVVKGGQAWTFTGTSTDADNPPTVSTPVAVNTVSSWEVPAGGGTSAGFTNTGLGYDGTNLLIGDYDNGRIVKATKAGVYVGEIELASSPATSVQGVAYDSTDGTYWVCHRAATNGTIRHYDSSGTLLGTISPAIGNSGPNGCFYDSANDRIVAAWDNGTVRGYDCSDGSLDETLSISVGAGQNMDGLALDPTDPNVIWAVVEYGAAGQDYIKKYNRTTGALIWAYACGADPETMCFVDSTIWMCFDRLFHSAEANGNRVHQLDITYSPTLSAIAASNITASGARLTVTT